MVKHVREIREEFDHELFPKEKIQNISLDEFILLHPEYRNSDLYSTCGLAAISFSALYDDFIRDVDNIGASKKFVDKIPRNAVVVVNYQPRLHCPREQPYILMETGVALIKKNTKIVPRP